MSGFVKECEGKYVLRFYALLDEVEDFFSDYPCFAGTGAGQDELDAGAGDSFGLGGGKGGARKSGMGTMKRRTALGVP